MRKIFNFVIKFSIYGLVVLMPLFWLPWTVDIHEFNKQYLLIFLAGIAFLAWLAKMVIVQKKLSIRRTPLDIFILAFMVIVSVSSVFSVDRASSWLGFYGKFSDSTIGLIAMCLMYFVIVNNIALKAGFKKFQNNFTGTLIDKKSSGAILSSSASYRGKACGLSLNKVFKLFLISSWIVVIVACFSVVGLWSKIPGLPQAMNSGSFNMVSRSFEGLAMFLVVAITIMTGLFLNKRSEKSKTTNRIIDKIQGSSRLILIVASMVLLMVIDFRAAWMALTVTTFFILAIAFWMGTLRKRVNRLVLPIALLFVTISYLSGVAGQIGLSGDETIFGVSLPQEILLDQSASLDIAWQSLRVHPVLGSGPATFFTNFAQFKPASMNEGRYWNIRFDRASSYFVETLSTMGVLGVLSYLSVIVVFLLIMFLSLRRMKKNASQRKKIYLPVLFAWLSLGVVQFVYPQNTVLTFYFWLFTALGIVVWLKVQPSPSRKLTFSFRRIPEIGLVMSVVLLILVFASAGLFYLAGRFYLADMAFKRSLTENEKSITELEKVVNLNKYRIEYRGELSRAYLNDAWAEANRATEERDFGLLQNLVSGSVEQAKAAIALSPGVVSAWGNLGTIYRDARGLVNGTLPFALEAFAKASELEPTNPLFFRELCRLNLISEGKDWDETIGLCQKAIELKPNYLDAHVQLALAFEQKGDLEEALKQMQAVLDKLKGVSFQRGSNLAGAATEVYFQLGRLHFNLNQIDDAIQMFEQSVVINPQYANAHYGLGMSYQSADRLNDALIQFRLVNQLVPDNEKAQAAIQQISRQLQQSLESAPESAQ